MTLIDQSFKPASRPALGNWLRRIPAEIELWSAAWLEFQQLRELDGRALKDMGLSEADRASVTVPKTAERMRHR